MAEEIQNRFEQASQYEAFVSSVIPIYSQLPKILLSHLSTLAGSNAKLLDVGCGTGTNIVTFAAHRPDWTFVGVDPEEQMLSFAKNKVNSINVQKRVTFIKGTVDAIPKEIKFDLATCIFVEHLLPDDGTKHHLIEGIFNNLANGGWLIHAGIYGDLETEWAKKRLKTWLEYVSLQGKPKEVLENVRRRATIEDSLIPEKRIVEIMENVGFINIEQIYQLQLFGAWAAQKPVTA